MTKFKKIIPALCMLLISAVLMGTSTYAWFSMNKSVNATGMEVTAKSDTTYLLIGTDKTIATTKTGLSNTVAAKYTTTDNANKTVNLVTYWTEAAKKIGNVDIAQDSWYTAYSTSSSSSTTNEQQAKVVNAGDGQYMLTYEMYLTLSAESVDYEGTIKIDLTKTALNASTGKTSVNTKPVSAVIVVGESDADQTLSLKGDSTATATTTSNVTLTASTAVKVTVYVYVDGAHSDVTSDAYNSGIDLNGSIALAFTLTDAKAA